MSDPQTECANAPVEDSIVVHRSEYRPPNWLVGKVNLTFSLSPKATRVHSKIEFQPNPNSADAHDFFLNGKELSLVRAAIDGTEVPRSHIQLSKSGLAIERQHVPSGKFTWEA